MKTIRLTATEPAPGMNIDLVGAFDYDRDPDGAALLCGHCGALLFDGYPVNSTIRVHVEGIRCPECGGQNTLDSALFASG